MSMQRESWKKPSLNLGLLIHVGSEFSHSARPAGCDFRCAGRMTATSEVRVDRLSAEVLAIPLILRQRYK